MKVKGLLKSTQSKCLLELLLLLSTFFFFTISLGIRLLRKATQVHDNSAYEASACMLYYYYFLDRDEDGDKEEGLEYLNRAISVAGSIHSMFRNYIYDEELWSFLLVPGELKVANPLRYLLKIRPHAFL